MRLYRYIAHKFWGPFFFALGIFTTLVMLGDIFEKMKNLSNGTTTVWDLLTYAAATFPNWLTTIMPVACLLGAISVISEMVANGEWTACVAGGFAPKDLFKPIVLCILLVVGATMLIQEFIVPSLNLKADEIYYTRIKPAENFNPHVETNVVIKISPTQMLFAKQVDPSKGVMNQVSLDSYNDQWNISTQIIAQEMQWDSQEGHWIFKNGIERTFLSDMDTTEVSFQQQQAPFTTPPQKMVVNKAEDKLLSVRDLTTKINFYRQSGLAHYTAETARQAKLATPFVTVIMCLLGMPFAISTRRKSKILNIIISLVIAFAFWWLISMFTSIGHNGYINPFVAGWGPVLFFGLAVFMEFKWLKL
jgi:lipopolysaccharide export system permease protein